MKKILIGSDPELFILNLANQKVISAIGLIPGTKENPHKVDDRDYFAIQTDNVLAEFNIPPTNDIMAFSENIDYMKEFIRQYVKQTDKNYDILCAGSAVLDRIEFWHPQSMEFGCEPDFNVYTNKKNIFKPNEEFGFRSAGCHIHVGYENPKIKTNLEIIKYLDVYLGLPSVLIDPDTKRKELYGKAGAFRMCKYGCEYRVLSGFFINSKESTDFVFKQTMKALEALNNNVDVPNPEDVERIINTNNIEEAKQLINKFKIA